MRQALKVLGPHAVAALPAGCMSATGFNFPQLSFSNNAMITPFASTSAIISGIEAGLRARGVKPDDCTVVGYLNDFIRKVEKARDIKGTRYIHVIAPCPLGWGVPHRLYDPSGQGHRGYGLVVLG